jgi:adenine specific DNA methylase Mod
MKGLLATDGSIFVHVGTHVSNYIGPIADEVFGVENRRNQIIVKRITKNLQRQFEKNQIVTRSI